MKYYIEKKIKLPFEETITKVTEELKKEGFGVLTEVDVNGTFKKKLDIDFRKYRILGACNPKFAHKAISAEDKIGTMLPCNVIVQSITDTETEVAAIDPAASMMAVENEELKGIAKEIQQKLQNVIDSL
jgi:uncharacterized protein (DUF302 family)